MPIYAYKCESCGHAKDVLQRMSDPLLTDCPVCGAPAFKKQVTAAGFQLKGSGWYATDFKGGGAVATAPAGEKANGNSDAKGDAKTDSKSDSKSDAKADAKTGDSKSESKSAAPASGGAASQPASKAASGTPAGTGAG